ncbi:MAG: hypothetical protein NW226_14030 [Microscillaceae bacterium]|nr:hypothetical protein [Microscillaceae bacterium]
MLHNTSKSEGAAGFVDEARSWLYNSARGCAGEKGLLDIILLS